MIRNLLILKNLKVQNANALSSSFTIGFPAITAWIGAVHALQRKLNKNKYFEDLKFGKAAILCHEIDLQSSDKNIIGMKLNHISRDDKDKAKNSNFKLSSTIPEARCHLDVSLIIEYSNSSIEFEEIEKKVKNILPTMKFAGGDLLDFKNVFTYGFDENKGYIGEFRKLRRKLGLGFLIIERRDLIEQETKNGVDAVDALIDYLKITKIEVEDKTDNKAEDKVEEKPENKKVVYERKTKGWLVPISTGFYALRDPTSPVEGQRDKNYKHCFVESVVTLGEFRFMSSSSFDTLDKIFWSYKYDKENGLYVCTQNFENKNEINN
jgi:CRISPR-associated protein Csy2